MIFIKYKCLTDKTTHNITSPHDEHWSSGQRPVKVDSSEIQAIHRIPGKIGEARPVIVKLVNSEVKYRIMRAKKNLPKKETVRLVDDVTKHNMGLITRLRNCKELESAWYFNCSVYGKTFDEKRIKFDIFDDINNKIAKRH